MPRTNDHFEYAGDGLWIDGRWCPPVHGGQDGDEDIGGDAVGEAEPDAEDVGEGGEGGTGGSSDAVFDTDATSSRPLSSQDILTRGRALAVQGVPFQLASLFAALDQLRARARGSTAAIFPVVSRQLNDLRSQYSAASSALARRLGAAGGGQTQRGRQQLLGRTARQVGDLLSSTQQQGATGLINVLGSFQPLLSQSAREPSVQTGQASPFNFQAAGAGIQGLISLAQQLGTTPAQRAESTLAGFRSNPDFRVGLPNG